MEQIDPSTLAGEFFNRMLPESLSSRVPALPKLNTLRRTLSSKSSPKNAPAAAPAMPSRRRSPAGARGKRPEPEPSVASVSDTLVSDGELDVVSYASSSASTTRLSASSGSSESGFDGMPSPPPHQQLGLLLPPPVVEDQHLRLLQRAGKPRRPEDRLSPSFGAHSYDSVDCRWSPSGIKWRYARQGAHLTSSASTEQDDPYFERRSYIDGVAYYLRGCPDDLSKQEMDTLLRSAPWPAEQPRPAPMAALRQPSDRGRPFLHHTVRWCVVSGVVLAHFLWCSLVTLGRMVSLCESQYNISNHIITRGHAIANAVGRHSLILSARIQRFGGGRAAQLVSGFALWVVESCAGGALEGFGEGIGYISDQESTEQEPNEDITLKHPW